MVLLLHLPILQCLATALRCFSARAPRTMSVAVIGRGSDNGLAFRPIDLLALRVPGENNGTGGPKRPHERKAKAEAMVVPHIGYPSVSEERVGSHPESGPGPAALSAPHGLAERWRSRVLKGFHWSPLPGPTGTSAEASAASAAIWMHV